MKTTAQDAASVTPKVVKIKLENDRVRVLEYTSDPGDKEAMHSHPAFVVYVLTGGTLRITPPTARATTSSSRPATSAGGIPSSTAPRTSARPSFTPSSSSWRRDAEWLAATTANA